MIEVIIVPAAIKDRDGVHRCFVEIKGIPHCHGTALVVSKAMTPAEAEEVKLKIEEALDKYRRPPRKGGKRKPKTSWERLLATKT
jgi:hypothetical protein